MAQPVPLVMAAGGPSDMLGGAASSSSRLSESWAVAEKHTGCFTGGKVVWSESTQVLGCICSEELQILDANTQEATRHVSHEGDGILTFAIDPSGQSVCTSHRSGLLRHFRLGPPITLARSWRAHEQLVADVCFDASGALVASGSVDRTVRVWDFTGYFCTHNFRGHASLVNLVRFHPSKLHVVSVADAEVRLWDLQSSTCIAVLKDHLASISSLCFAKVKGSLHQLVTAGRDQVVNIWTLEDKDKKNKVARSIPVFENVEGVAVLPTKGLRQASLQSDDSKDSFQRWLASKAELPTYVILTVGDKALLRVWNPNNGQNLKSQASLHAAKGVLRQVHCLDHSNGRRIVTIGEDLNLIIWSLPEFSVVNYIMGNNEEIVHVQMIPELTWPEPSQEDEDRGALTSRSAMQVDAKRFVCITNDEHPRLVNCRGFGANLLRGHTDVVIACDVSADGQWIATGGKDQTIRVWSAAGGHCACLLAGHAGAVSALSFPKRRPKSAKAMADSASQKLWLVSGSQDKTMKVWELPKIQQLDAVDAAGGSKELQVEKSKVTVVAHSKEVNDVVVAPNNKVIASGGHDKLVRIWKFPEAELLGECKGHRRGVWCVAFSPIDQVVASASGDTTVRLWNLKDFSAIRAFQGHTSAVLRVCFLSNGMQLMSSGVDGLLKLWQIRTAECAATFEEHTGKVWCIDVIGDRMVSGGSDAKLCVWEDTTVAQAKERHDAQAEAAMKDTRIGLLVREGKVEEALSLALDLDRPAQMRQILTDHAMNTMGQAISTEKKDDASSNGSKVDLQQWIMSLGDSQLEKLVELLERWNSNRKMASLAQMLMGLLLLALPPAKLLALEGMNATCDAILSYSSRHMARVEALLQKTFLFDLVLQTSSQGMALQDEAGADSRILSAEDGASLARPSAESALSRTMEVLLGKADEEGSDEEEDPGQSTIGTPGEPASALTSEAKEDDSDVDILPHSTGQPKEALGDCNGAAATGAALDSDEVTAGGKLAKRRKQFAVAGEGGAQKKPKRHKVLV